MAAEFAQILIRAKDETKTAFDSAARNMREMGDGIERLRSRLKSSFGDVASIATSIGAGLSVKSLAQMADEFSSLQARLKLASRDMVEFNAANADLIRISSSAQAPLAETATLYTRIAASVKDLGVSQSDIAGTTEAVALALKISGATAEEASSAMLQFSQSIASGVLRGEEFNAVNEAAPRLLQALAQSLNVPVGSLREMAKQGQLTRDVLITGLLNQLPKLQQEAATLPKTIGAAFTDLNNKLILTVGQFDKVTGATTALNSAIGNIGTIGIQTIAVLGANVAFVFKGIGTEIGGIAAQLSRLAVGDFAGFSAIGKMMKDDALRARKELDDFEKRILGIGQKASATAAAAAGSVARPVPNLPDKNLKSSRAVSDPLAGLLSSTDIGRLREFDKTVALINQRFNYGKKDTELYTQMMTKLVETTFANNFKQFAEDQKFMTMVMKDGQDTINETNQAMQDWKDTVAGTQQDLIDMIDPVNVLTRKLTELDKFDGFIDPEVLAAARLAINAQIDDLGKAKEKFSELDSFAKTAAENIQNSFADFLFDPFDKGLKGMAQSFGQTIQHMIANAVAADLTKRLFGDLVQGGSGSGLAGGLLKSVGSLLSFDGGGYTGDGWRSGGIDGKGGFLSVIHPRETIVDHTRGQSVGGGLVVHQNIVVNGGNTQEMRRAAGQGLRDAYAVMRGAERYV